MRIKNILLLLLICIFAQCKKEPEITEAERVTRLLINGGNWSPQQITADGTDVLELFEGFTLRFQANNTYTSTGETPIWARSGLWSFTNDTAKIISKEDDNLVEIISISETGMVLRLNWDETTYKDGRSASINGVHEFVMNPQ
jgi:hypothetical protein